MRKLGAELGLRRFYCRIALNGSECHMHPAPSLVRGLGGERYATLASFLNLAIVFPSEVWGIVQDDTEQRAVHFDCAVIGDEAQFAESVHEETHA